MGTVHVRVCHDDDSVVTCLFDVEIVFADSRSHCGNKGANFVVVQDFVDAGFFDVQYLPFQGKDGLEFAVSSLLGAATGRIALYQVNFALGRVRLLAVGQFSGQGGNFKGSLAAGQVPGFSGRLAGLGRHEALPYDTTGYRWILFKKCPYSVVASLARYAFHFPIPQFGLGLTFKLRVGNFYRDDRGQTLAHVVAGNGRIRFLDQCRSSWRNH